jgi:hypothetical protein
MTTINTTVTSAGIEPTPISTIHDDIISQATAIAPGLTATLPASLIDDVASTGAAAAALTNQAAVDIVNSLAATGANMIVLNNLAQQTGIPAQQTSSYTSVTIQFTGPAGFMINAGFLVSDGSYQYQVLDAAIIPTSGILTGVTAQATETGSWAVPAGTVTTIITSLPDSIILTVTNPTAGTQAQGSETNGEFRQRVLEATAQTGVGTPNYLRTQLTSVANVTARLVRTIPATGGFIVMCGGSGDPYSIAGAIYNSVLNPANIIASTLNITGITQANPGVITTANTHGFSSGQVINITGIVGMTALNNVALTIAVIDAHNFSIGVNTTSYSAWVSGGVITPNLRNVSVSVNDYPDVYKFTYAIPLLQTVTMTIGWDSNSANTISNAAIAQEVIVPIASYINGLTAGMALNLNAVRQVFLDNISSVLNVELLTNLTFTVYVNGVLATLDSGTQIISGDSLSYWQTDSAGAGFTVVNA